MIMTIIKYAGLIEMPSSENKLDLAIYAIDFTFSIL